MKKVSALALMGVVCFSNVGYADIEFSQAIPTVKPVSMEFYDTENMALEQALEIHNLMNKMWETRSQISDKEYSEKNLELQQKRMKAMTKCNIDRLSEQFKDPAKVWNKMTKEYDRREKDLALYVNSAENLTDEDRERMKKEVEEGILSDEGVAEVMAYWSIGNDILTDVYQNQDKWGERPEKDSDSFPLWADQKYNFDKKWDGSYRKLNAYFGVPPQGRPIVGKEKYDYAKRQKVEQAHRQYVALLMAQSPAKAAGLPLIMKEAPMPPRPLPPKEESLLYIESDDPEKQVFPGLPEPWQKYKNNKFKDIAPDGEMAEDFAKGLSLKESAKHLTSEERNNRLVVYQALKKSLDGADKAHRLVKQSTEAAVSETQDQLENYMVLKEDFDLSRKKDFKEALEQLIEQKNALLQKAIQRIEREALLAKIAWAQTDEKKRLNRVDTVRQIKKDNAQQSDQLDESLEGSISRSEIELLTAMQKDVDGKIFLTETNAKDIDRKLQEFAAQKALEEKQREWEKKMEAENEKPIDRLCINGGTF